MEEIRIFASHHQFYVQDAEPRGNPGDAGFWSKEAFARRLALADGIVGIGTGTYGLVQVRVEQHTAEPELDFSVWDHITECDLEVRSNLILVFGCISTSGLFFMVKPGHFRVRVCHANLCESEQEVPNDWQGEFRDWYLVQFWPEKSAIPPDARVLKQR